jgi:hypothetical protein
MQTGELIPLAASLISSLLNMPSIQVAVVLVRWCGKGDLMDLIVNQLRLTGAGTMQLVGVTSVFMALLSVTSKVYMKVRSHRNFIISHFHLALCSLSKPPLHRQLSLQRLPSPCWCPFSVHSSPVTCTQFCFSLELDSLFASLPLSLS